MLRSVVLGITYGLVVSVIINLWFLRGAGSLPTGSLVRRFGYKSAADVLALAVLFWDIPMLVAAVFSLTVLGNLGLYLMLSRKGGKIA